MVEDSRSKQLRRIVAYRGPSWPLVVGILATGLFTAGQTVTPLIVARIVDGAIDRGEAGQLLFWCLTFAGVAVVSTVSREGAEVSFGYSRESTLIRLRSALLEHVQRLPVAELDRRPSGTLSALFMSDTPKAASLLDPVTRKLVMSVFQLVALLVAVSWKYGATIFLMFLLIPVYLAVPALLGRPTRRAALRIAEAEAEVHSGIKESIDLVREIKSFTRERWNASRIGRLFRRALDREMVLRGVRSLYGIDHAAYGITVAFLYWYGGRQVLAGEITVGELVALVWFLGLLSSPINTLNQVHSRLQTVHASAARVFDLLEVPAESAEPPERIAARAPRAVSVELQDVSFHYEGRSEASLNRVSCRIEAGEQVAVVGPSGAGKSTLVHLLLRFYEPESGRILVGGRDIRDYGLEDLRRWVGLVPQEPQLFSVSLRDNLRLGNLGSTNEEIWEAARVANAEGFISALDEGLDTDPGEAGVRLSVGQKQRIAIARVVLRNPSLLILDEATSALDPESEGLVREALGRIMRGRTVIVVAHRLNWVTDCDRILVLDRGRLVAQGRHEELMAQSPLYHRLVRRHLGSHGLRLSTSSAAESSASSDAARDAQKPPRQAMEARARSGEEP